MYICAHAHTPLNTHTRAHTHTRTHTGYEAPVWSLVAPSQGLQAPDRCVAAGVFLGLLGTGKLCLFIGHGVGVLFNTTPIH